MVLTRLSLSPKAAFTRASGPDAGRGAFTGLGAAARAAPAPAFGAAFLAAPALDAGFFAAVAGAALAFALAAGPFADLSSDFFLVAISQSPELPASALEPVPESGEDAAGGASCDGGALM